MADNDDAMTTDESLAPTGTEESPEAEGTDAAAQVASYRKRQAGAEAARQMAEKKLADAEARLAVYEAQNRTASEQELANVATLQERLSAAEAKAAAAEARAEQRILDIKYPNARKKLPEITDEIRLAEFEAMFGEDVVEAPTPARHNESKTAGQKAQTELTADELKAEFISGADPGWFNQIG